MSIDRQRYAAVRRLEALGYHWDGNAWRGPGEVVPAGNLALLAAADAMHDELTSQIEDLEGCTEDSSEAETMERLTGLAQAYEAARPRD